jgi:hypothetical protein
MKHLKNLLVFIALWSIAYYFGSIEFAAYDSITDYKDFLAIGSALFGMYWLYRKYS